MSKGCNQKLYVTLKSLYPQLQLQASGGISSYTDINKLEKANIDGAIIGKALYEKKIDLKEALKC
jgi:phosphoribosylformimino-5-aminoimidazole carboxamide ribotide isomerase